MTNRQLLNLAALVIIGPPLMFACGSYFLLFMALIDPWGPLIVFLALGLPLGVLLVGLIIRYGGRRDRGGFEPATAWKFNEGIDQDG